MEMEGFGTPKNTFAQSRCAPTLSNSRAIWRKRWPRPFKKKKGFPNRASILLKQITPPFYSIKSGLHFSEQNRARVLESLFFLNRPCTSFLAHRMAIGLLWSKSRLGEHIFGCAKAIHLHLSINLLFLRYFSSFLFMFFLFVHQFICPKLKN